jgi:hypothetical protein
MIERRNSVPISRKACVLCGEAASAIVTGDDHRPEADGDTEIGHEKDQERMKERCEFPLLREGAPERPDQQGRDQGTGERSATFGHENQRAAMPGSRSGVHTTENGVIHSTANPSMRRRELSLGEKVANIDP